MEFSDYIVFADESGDHGLTTIDPEFPVFSLVFCIFRKAEYLEVVEPSLRRLKYKFFGHDAAILHEREIRKALPPFDFLRHSPTLRASFHDDLTALMAGVPMVWFACVIDKIAFTRKYRDPWNPYEVAMHFGMEKICRFLVARGETGKMVHVLFEARGKQEDEQLELEFRRVVSNQKQWGWRQIDFTRCGFEPVFVKKAANMAGHQISDLIARPLALKALRPEQANRAVDAIQTSKGYFKLFP